MKKICYFLLLIICVVNAIFAQDSIPYIAPNLDKKIFDIEKLSLTKDEKQEIATAIGSYVRDTQNTSSKKGLLQTSKLMGIALRLDDKNRDAAITNSKLKRGVRDPQVVTQDKGLPILVSILLKKAKNLNQKPGENDKQLATYLFELIVDLDPKNDDAAYELEVMTNKIKCDWSWAAQENNDAAKNQNAPENSIQKANIPSDPNIALVKNIQSSVKGLIVFSQESGKMYGSTLDIILTFSPNNNKVDWLFQKEKKIGQEMIDSCNEALGYVRTKYLYMQKGDYRISFGDRYTDKDGGSAGAAFTLTMLSVFEGFKIDTNCAMTGDISVDGKIRIVGGVIEKIRGAFLDKCNITCIPNKNTQAFHDYVVLFGLASLKDIQVFGLNHIDDAKRIMTTEKDPIIVSCISQFQDICKNVNFVAPLLTTDKQTCIQQLEGIKSKLPEYENVNILIEALSGKFEKNLSLITSFERLFTSTDSFLPFLNEKIIQKGVVNERVYDQNGQIVIQKKVVEYTVDTITLMTRENITGTLVKNTLEELNILKNISHPKLKNLSFELITFVTNIDKVTEELERLKKTNANSNQVKNSLYFKRAVTSREALRKMLSEFKGDEKIIEKFFRDSLQQ